MTTKNIIFDLGGVIIDLGFDKMVEQFESLGISDFAQYFNPLKQQTFFEALELGLIGEAEFYQKFRELTQSNLTNQEIEAAWNLILTPFKAERMTRLEQLARQYKLYLFSNTNAIHARKFEADCLSQTGKVLTDYFTKVYYSHDLHLRKPDSAAFQAVIDDAMIDPQETVFVDDNADNILGAQSVGLQTIHLVAPQTILDLEF